MVSRNIDLVPEDEYNKILIENAHPQNWENPVPDGRYNLVAIGAGTAGLVAAAGAAAMGAKVALVERHLMGGDCLNVGCVPSKGLIRAGRAVADVRDAGGFGVNVPSGHTVDFGKVMERMRRLRAKISPNDSVKRFADMGIDVYLGEGSFLTGNRVKVGDSELQYSKAVIATGARATAPPIPGLEDTGYLTNENLFNLTELPKRLAVIGAGPIGCEMAQAFTRFGAKVHLLEISNHVLPREPIHIAEVIEKALTNDGVSLVTNCSISKVEKADGGKLVTFLSEKGSETALVDEILVSAGRMPNLENLNLEEVGVEYDARTGVSVNQYLQTSNNRIYAAGDICSEFKFTHAAEALAAIVIQNALFLRTKKAGGLIVPWSIYTDPEVAHVGLYPTEAEAQGIDTTTYSYSFDEVDRAILDGDEDGLVELYVKKGTDVLVGGTIVARHAGEMINEVTLAMTGKLGLGTITATIHPYPTQADGVRKAAKEYYKSRLTPRIKKIMDRWMKFHR